MIKRTITAICAIALFIPVCYFSDTIVFPAVMAFLSTVAVYEMLKCVGLYKKKSVSVPSYLLGAAMPLIPYFIDKKTVEIEFALCIIYLIVIFASDIFSKGKTEFPVSASAFMGVFYIAVSFTCIVLIRKTGDYVNKGDKLAILYASNEALFRDAKQKFVSSLEFSADKSEKPQLIF